RKTLDYESPAERFNKCVASIGRTHSQKRTLLAWNVSLPRAGQRLYAANPASNDLLHIAIFEFEV
ncbi:MULTISPECIES: hypothetical protein, partial [Pantoea]|uniref:hypothetical protein n=1 Tax=Pantoea TaxID=53335 RepID=UPI00197D407F